MAKQMEMKSYSVPEDPLFKDQWHLVSCYMQKRCMHIIDSSFLQLNTGQFGSDFAGNDLNVERAWLQGITGCNVSLEIVDDGQKN